MAELNIRVNTQQAAAGAKAFERIINDIKQAARSLDQQNLTQFGGALRSLTSSGANLLAMVNQIADALGRMNYSLQSIRAANYGAAMAGDFSKLRDMVRDTRAQITGLNTELKEAVTLAGRMGTAAQRVRRARAPAAESVVETAAETAAVMSTALVPATTRALTVFQAFRPVASGITLVTTAVTGLAREMRLLTSGAESADRSLRQLVTTAQRAQTAFRVSPGGGAARANEFFGVAQRPATPLQLGPGGMGEAGAMTAYQRPPSAPIITPQPGAGLTPYVHQGEAVNRFGTALMNVQQPLQATSRAIEHTKERKDRLDKNLKDTAQQTLPKFNAAWLATIGYMALFTVRRILDELTDLGKALFKTGEEFERIFALFKAGAGGDIDEAARRMQVAADAARKFGLDLTQTAGDYGRLQAAAKGSSLEGAKMEEIFRNLVSAQAVFGQSTEKGTGLIKVFTDILGKGRLQSEELVKQLGNVVPGAFRVVAQSLGKTTTELQDAVAKGSVSVEEVLVKLARELNRIYGAEALQNVNRLGGAFNVLKTSITEVALLIVNMSTGIMSGSGSIFGQNLIATFKQLSDLLSSREIQTRIVELANFITHMLSQAFQGLIAVLQFATEHMIFFTGAITALTSAAIVAGIVKLHYAMLGLFTSIQTFAKTPGGLAVLVLGLAASLAAGAYMANQFQKSMEGVAEGMDKVFADREKNRATAASGNQNPADQTRAVQEALNRVEREQRAFVEGVRNEAQMLELAAVGVSTLSARYEAYLNVLERIKAQEVKELFTILSPGDAATMKRRLTEALLAAELVKQAVSDIVDMFKSLDQAQQTFSIQAATATADLRAMQEGTFSELGSRIQEQYDQKVIPVMRRVREELRSIADPNLRNTLVGAFNAWSVAMRDNIVHIEKLKDLMAGVTDITKQLRDFRFGALATDLTSTVRAGERFVDTTITNTSEAFEKLIKESFAPLEPPKVRTLGDELKEGFNPVDVGKEMGRSFTEVFVQAMEASVQKLIDQMKAMAVVPPQAQPTGSTGTGGGGTMAAAPQEIEAYITEANRLYPQVRKDLIRAVMLQESSFSPEARGSAGEIGLMQLKAGTAKDLGVDPYNNQQNVIGGTKYIAQHLARYGGDEARALAAYNRGPGAVPIQGEIPLKGQQYAQQVQAHMARGAGTTQAVTDAATTPATTAAATAPARPITPDAAIVRDVGRLLNWAWGKVTTVEPPKPGGPWFGAPEQKHYLPGQPVTPPAPPTPAYTVNPNMYPQPIGPPAKTAEQTAEETKRIHEQVEAIRKRTQAQMDGEAQADKAAKEMEQRRAQEEATAKQVQDAIDGRMAELSKEIDLVKNLGVVRMSADSEQQREIAGYMKAKEFKDRYNAATEEQLRQVRLLGQAEFTKKAIDQGNEYTLSLEKQTKALNDETDALVRNRHESSLTADASAQARQRERDALEGGRAFGPDEEARRAQASKDATAAQIRSSVEASITSSEKEQRALQMEIDSLQDNTIERAANLEMRRRNDEQLRNAAGLSEDQKRRILEANEALRQTRLAQQQANGPLRQYIDSLADFSSEATISNAMQERFAELFSGMEESIISFTKTGKFNFEEFANSFIESIQRMVLQALIFRPIAEALNQALSPGGGAAPGTDFPGASGGGGGKTNWISTVFGLVKTGIGAYTGNPALAASGATQTVGGFTGGDAPGMATGGWITETGIQRFQGGGMAGFGSDTVPAMLTPGEMVLNKEQQNAVFGKKDQQQNNTFNMVFPNVSNEDQARKTAAQAYSEMSSRLERQRQRDGLRTRR